MTLASLKTALQRAVLVAVLLLWTAAVALGGYRLGQDAERRRQAMPTPTAPVADAPPNADGLSILPERPEHNEPIGD